MKNNILTILIMFTMLTMFTSATSISPDPFQFTTNVGQNSSTTITINNTYNFTIFDFSFPLLESKGFKFPNISVPANTTISVPINIITNSSHYGIINEKAEFKFYVNLPETITTYSINITETGFSDTYKTIRTGDTIRWNNKDDVSHTIYSTEFGSISIPENSSGQFTFNNIGNFYYYDEYFGSIFSNFQGYIEVINRTEQQKAHNPNYDISWNVDLSSISNPTNLSVSNSKSEYSINYNSYTKGLLTIENIGTENAEGISMTSDYNWITFEKTDFNINKGDTDWIEYEIFPHSLTTNETDRNYTINIYVKAKNSEQKNISIKVYIPFKEITNSLDSDLAFVQYLENVYCPRYPCSKLCSPELPQCALGGSGNYSGNLEINANISKLDLYNLMKDISKLRDSSSRSDNALKSLADVYGITVPELKDLINQSMTLQQNNEEKVKSSRATSWIIGSFVLFAGIIIFVINEIAKRKEKIGRSGLPYSYKR